MRIHVSLDYIRLSCLSVRLSSRQDLRPPVFLARANLKSGLISGSAAFSRQRKYIILTSKEKPLGSERALNSEPYSQES
jgi:hypothetical protein